MNLANIIFWKKIFHGMKCVSAVDLTWVRLIVWTTRVISYLYLILCLNFLQPTNNIKVFRIASYAIMCIVTWDVLWIVSDVRTMYIDLVHGITLNHFFYFRRTSPTIQAMSIFFSLHVEVQYSWPKSFSMVPWS